MNDFAFLIVFVSVFVVWFFIAKFMINLTLRLFFKNSHRLVNIWWSSLFGAFMLLPAAFGCGAIAIAPYPIALLFLAFSSSPTPSEMGSSICEKAFQRQAIGFGGIALGLGLVVAVIRTIIYLRSYQTKNPITLDDLRQ